MIFASKLLLLHCLRMICIEEILLHAFYNHMSIMTLFPSLTNVHIRSEVDAVGIPLNTERSSVARGVGGHSPSHWHVDQNAE